MRVALSSARRMKNGNRYTYDLVSLKSVRSREYCRARVPPVKRTWPSSRRTGESTLQIPVASQCQYRLARKWLMNEHMLETAINLAKHLSLRVQSMNLVQTVCASCILVDLSNVKTKDVSARRDPSIHCSIISSL